MLATMAHFGGVSVGKIIYHYRTWFYAIPLSDLSAPGLYFSEDRKKMSNQNQQEKQKVRVCLRC